MNVKELKQCRKQLERDLAEDINNLISIFEKETGVGVSNVSVNLINIPAVGIKARHVMESVNVDILI
jgi:hypothetical protein